MRSALSSQLLRGAARWGLLTLVIVGISVGALLVRRSWAVQGEDPPGTHTLFVTARTYSGGALGVTVTVVPGDTGGLADGVTSFTRSYNTGTPVTLTAAAPATGQQFQGWSIDGAAPTSSNLQVTLSMTQAHTAQACYWTNAITVGCAESIQWAIDNIAPGGTITLNPCTYNETLYTRGKSFTLQSLDPADPDIVDQTIIAGVALRPSINFTGTESASCVLDGLTITGGHAETYPHWWGGGISGGPVGGPLTHATIRRCVIRNNTAMFGGGVWGVAGIVEDCVIRNNGALSHGGGLYWCPGTIRGNRIEHNSATDGGGLSHCEGGTVEANLIAFNTAAINGGGVNWSSNLVNNVIASNRAVYGAGLHHARGDIVHNTLWGNRARWPGAGVWYSGTPGVTTRVTNNIIHSNAYSNTWGEETEWHYDQQMLWWDDPISPEPDHCCIQNGPGEDWTQVGTGNVTGDPRLLFPENESYLIDTGSPCINAGAALGVATDFQGNARAGVPDIGADEFTGATWPTAPAGVQVQGDVVDQDWNVYLDVSWLPPPPTAAVIGYNVYVSTSADGPFQRVNEANNGLGCLPVQGDGRIHYWVAGTYRGPRWHVRVTALAPGAAIHCPSSGGSSPLPLQVEQDTTEGPPGSADDMHVRILLLDPGHGTTAGGAERPGVHEGALTMEFAQQVQHVMHTERFNDNVIVAFTHADDPADYPNLQARGTIAHRVSIWDLFANPPQLVLRSPPQMMISLHFDAGYPGPANHVMTMFVYPNDIYTAPVDPTDPAPPGLPTANENQNRAAEIAFAHDLWELAHAAYNWPPGDNLGGYTDRCPGATGDTQGVSSDSESHKRIIRDSYTWNNNWEPPPSPIFPSAVLTYPGILAEIGFLDDNTFFNNWWGDNPDRTDRFRTREYTARAFAQIAVEYLAR